MLALEEEDVKDDDATLRWLNQNVRRRRPAPYRRRPAHYRRVCT